MARADLLRELLAPIPRENMHVNKKLVAIDEAPAGLLLKFEDGTSTTVDVLLGADGIFGFVRGHVLGSDHEAVKAVPAGWAGTVNMVPFEKAREVLGAQWSVICSI
jgi:salicylate hydroxylase